MSNVRILAGTCERCQNKLQSVSELLILSCDARPVKNESFSLRSSFPQLVDRIVSLMKNTKVRMKSIVDNVHMISSKYSDICDELNDLTSVMIQFMEHCSHTAYLRAMSYKDCCQAIPGLVDRYSVCFAGLEIKLSCIRLKKTRIEELSSQLIIDLCSNISKHISLITDICRSAGEKVRDESTQDQFKLCVKSVTCAAGCLIASIKSYKSHPNDRHHNRVLVFCDPVLSSSQALVTFATEDDFIGNQAVLTSEARDAQKAILGACMSIVSACIQLCKTVRDLAYDMMTSHHRDKLRMCVDTVDRVSGQMVDILNKHNMEDGTGQGRFALGSPNSAPGHLANLFQKRHLSDRSPDSPPNDRFSDIYREQSLEPGRGAKTSRENSPLQTSDDRIPRDTDDRGNSGSIDASSDKDSGHSNASR